MPSTSTRARPAQGTPDDETAQLAALIPTIEALITQIRDLSDRIEALFLADEEAPR